MLIPLAGLTYAPATIGVNSTRPYGQIIFGTITGTWPGAHYASVFRIDDLTFSAEL
jgi:hypothetical protein